MQPMLAFSISHSTEEDQTEELTKPHEHDSKPLLLPVYTSPVNSAGDDDVLVATRHESSTLELFFDLFLIANLSTFTATHSIVDVPSLVAYVGLLGILWFTWFQITLHDVRFAIDSMFQRICKVIQFVIFVGFALVGSSFNPGGKEHNNTNFRILCYLLFISRLLLAIEYSVALAHIRKKSKQLTLPLVTTIIVLILCAGSFYAMTPAFTAASGNGLRIYYVWYIILLVEVIVVLGTAMFWRSHSFKKTHLMERMGLLTLIVIGEGAIGVTKTVGKLMGSSGLSFENVFLVICIVIILVFLWAMYFDNHPHYHYGTIRQQLWALLHFPLHCGIVGVVEGSQQIAIARYLFKKLFSIEKSIRQACLVENLDGAALATALTTAVKALKLEDKAESKDQVAIILQDIYEVSNVTGICSATNITNLASGVPFPEGFGTIVIDSFIGLFESSGINIPKDSDTETIARSTYETLYIYYWGSLFITVTSFSVLLLLTRAKEHRPMIFERFAISARGVAAVIFVIMGATAGSQNAVYYLIKSPAILPMAAAILFLILCADRIGRQRSVRRQENSISHFDRNKDRSTYTRASDT